MLQQCIDYCKQYDSNVVYKSCGDYIVVLKKLADTITNESRDNVKDQNNAKFRADKLEVICIFSKNNTSEQLETINNTCYSEKRLTYTVGKIVSVGDYNMDPNKVCTSGIHYFKNITVAFYYEFDVSHFTGHFISWHDNGNKRWECDYVDGKQHDHYIRWDENGNMLCKCEYINDKWGWLRII
jgi:hypothetical protein